MTEPKLLTEADMTRFNSTPWGEIKAELRERGLIAPEPEPEPVDPLLIEAREIAASYWERLGDHIGAAQYRSGEKDIGRSGLQIVLAAIRRGMELRPEITREMVREATDTIPYWVFEDSQKRDIADRFYAALKKQVQQ